MYEIDIITIFPELFNNFLENSIIKRAQLKQKVSFAIHNLRDYATDKLKTVDDIPYGGGPGMVLKAEPVFRAIDAIKKQSKIKPTVILLSPQGHRFDQALAKKFALENKHLVMICGRYEGFDQRIMKLVDFEISIGDYVLNGGEIPAMVLCEAVVRLLPDVLGRKESYENDSFYNGYLDYPHYTRPEIYKGMKIPDVLKSGDHKKIKEWREKESLNNTLNKRPDLLKNKKKRV